jgi:toxin FitB
MTWLVDTNVLSELARPRPDPGVVEWADQVEQIFLSVITYEEIMFGLGWKPKTPVRTWFERFVEEACELLPVTAEIALRAGLLRGELKSQGVTRTQADMIIAATARVHELTLVTRNVRDFEGCRIDLLNPFS